MLPTPPKPQSDFVPRRPLLVVERGGLYRSGETQALRVLETGFRDAAAGAKRGTNSKAYPGPMIAALAQALTSAIARRIYGYLLQNWKGGGNGSFAMGLIDAIRRCDAILERKFSVRRATIITPTQSQHTHRTDKEAA
jgi:hypothetical protein